MYIRHGGLFSHITATWFCRYKWEVHVTQNLFGRASLKALLGEKNI